MDMFSQINVEVNSNILKLCKSVAKNFNVDPKACYKWWVDSLPRELVEDENEGGGREDESK
jgi:hypothetical protein